MKGRQINEFGKFNRILRLKHGEILGDMAEKLNVTVSYLSAIENGKREVPDKFIEEIPVLYNLNDEDKQNFLNAVEASRKNVKINISMLSSDDKSAIIALAKKIEDGSDDKMLKTIFKIINE